MAQETTLEESELGNWVSHNFGDTDDTFQWEYKDGRLHFPFSGYSLPDSSKDWYRLPKFVCDDFFRQFEAASELLDLDCNPIEVSIGGKIIPFYSEQRADRGVKDVKELKGTEPNPSLDCLIYGVKMHMNKSKRWISKGERKGSKLIDKPCRIRYTTFSEDFETETKFVRRVVTRVEPNASVGIAYIVNDSKNNKSGKRRKVNEMSGELLSTSSPGQSNSDDVDGEIIVYEGYKSVQTQLYVGSYVPETIRSALHAQDFEAVTDTFRDLQVGAMGTMGFTSQELNEHVGIIGVNEVVVPVVQNLLERADNTDAKIANLDERVKHLATSSLVYLDTPAPAPTLDSLFLRLESSLPGLAIEIQEDQMKILQEIVRILHEAKGEYVPVHSILKSLKGKWPILSKTIVNSMMYNCLKEIRIAERQHNTQLWRLQQ